MCGMGRGLVMNLKLILNEFGWKLSIQILYFSKICNAKSSHQFYVSMHATGSADWQCWELSDYCECPN